MSAQRIQRKRTKGWKMPEGAVYVGRPTKWGNPWLVTRDFNAHEAVMMFRLWYSGWYGDTALPRCPVFQVEELKGRDLACWCRLDQPCHADVLLELANAAPQPQAGES